MKCNNYIFMHFNIHIIILEIAFRLILSIDISTGTLASPLDEAALCTSAVLSFESTSFPISCYCASIVNFT